MPVHPQHEHGIIPCQPATGFAPLGYAQLDVQPQVALRLWKSLDLQRYRGFLEMNLQQSDTEQK